MPWHCRAAPAREEPETVVEPGRKALYAEGCGARRSQLDCQRDAIETTTDSCDRCRNACVRRKMWRGRAGPLDEQPDRAVAQGVLAVRAAFFGHSERRYRVDPLAVGPEWLAAGGDYARCRVGAQQRLGHAHRGLDHMLAI